MLATPSPIDDALSHLVIDLGAIRHNYRRLRTELNGIPCAGVVKADAYGLGADKVAPVLWSEGCRIFFVATLEEAVRLRGIVPDASIACLNGLASGTEPVFTQHRIVPVLNAVEQIVRWRAHGALAGEPLPAMLHVDTGMSRLGLDAGEFERILEAPEMLDGVDWLYVMSHLASADDPESPMNAAQLQSFHRVRQHLPRGMKASLANSSGVFLGADYHFDLARPGIAVYGGRPAAGQENPMRCPVRIDTRILQVREIAPGDTVGYGGTWTAARPSRIATLAAGYADGYLRSLSSAGSVWVGDRLCPVVGRVSMDLITVDVTDVAPERARPGDVAELLGPNLTPDAVADAAGTIGYEVLTSLGNRYVRHYIDDA